MVLSNKAKGRRRKVRIERKWGNLYYCDKCGNKFGLSDKHHKLCNQCWNEQHPFETMINLKKSRKW